MEGCEECPDFEAFNELCGSAYFKQQFIDMELEVLSDLDYQLNLITPFHFLLPYLNFLSKEENFQKESTDLLINVLKSKLTS